MSTIQNDAFENNLEEGSLYFATTQEEVSTNKKNLTAQNDDFTDNPPTPDSRPQQTPPISCRQSSTICESCLQQALRDAVENSIGISAAVVWEFDNQTGILTSPEGGWYRSATFIPEDAIALDRLENKNNPDYVPLNTTIAGVDVAGVLWSQTHPSPITDRIESDNPASIIPGHNRNSQLRNTNNRRSQMNLFTIMSQRVSRVSQRVNRVSQRVNRFSIMKSTDVDTARKTPKMVWRDLTDLENDPDTLTSSPRLELLLRAGLRKAAAVTHVFQASKRKSTMVIYYARETVRQIVLQEKSNADFMERGANVISAILAMNEVRGEVLAEKERIRERALRKMKMALWKDPDKIFKINHAVGNSDDKEGLWWKDMLIPYFNKFWGGRKDAPPALSIRQSFLTFAGCFIALIVIASVNNSIKGKSNGELSFSLPPFGALMTLQYALTSAPASQPRNIIIGHVLVGFICFCLNYVPEYILSGSLRIAFAPALSIASMAALGVTHPPAGAQSVLYVLNKTKWIDYYLLTIMANFIAIIIAVIINNVSSKRQYPSYWTKFDYVDLMKTCRHNLDKKKENVNELSNHKANNA